MKEENTSNTGNVKFSEANSTYNITHGIDPVICPPELWADEEDWFEKELNSVAKEEKEQCCKDEACDFCVEESLTLEELLGLLLDDHTAILNRLGAIEEQLKKIKKKI